MASSLDTATATSPTVTRTSNAPQNPTLSIIIPVYNVEDYLDACLDSLEAQTFTNIEMVCVNDGSPDGSRDILTKRQSQDPRIVIVDKPNGGLSSARNAGINAARGTYIGFLDADDRFTPQRLPAHCGDIRRNRCGRGHLRRLLQPRRSRNALDYAEAEPARRDIRRLFARLDVQRTEHPLHSHRMPQGILG